MAPLHPELAQLKEKFDRLLDDYEAGHIDYETAAGTLKSMVVIDGSGAHWSMTEDGEYLRTFPGEAGRPADPVSFMPPQLPARPQSSAPWAPQQQPDLMTPPPGMFGGSPAGPVPQPGPPFGGPGGVPGQPFPLGAPGVPGAEAPQPASKPKKVKVAKEPKAAKAPKATKLDSAKPGGSAVSKVMDAVGDFDPKSLLHGKAKTGVVAVVCVLLLFVGYTQLNSGEEGSSGIPAGPAAPAAPGADLPVDPAAPQAAPTPTGDEITQLVSAVTSGRRDVAAAAVATPGDPVVVALNTGTLHGYEQTGLTVTTGPVSPSGEGAVQDWSLVNAEDQKVYATAKVSYVRAEGGWKLQGWPGFVRK